MGFFLIRLLQEPMYKDILSKEINSVPLDNDGFLSYEKVKSLPYLDAIIKESLRMDPTASGAAPRITDKDCILDGYFIPKGTTTFTPLSFIHKHHSAWGDPHVFRPERFMNEGVNKPREQDKLDRFAVEKLYLPFSIGPKNCIGKNFAQMEMKLFLSNFLRRYDYQDIPGQSLEKNQYITLQLETGSYRIGIKKRSNAFT